MLTAVENVVVGPIIAVVSFVCSVGNVPLAAVLWSGGISFAGVLAFLFADLIVLPIIAIYRKYYGTRYTLRIVALMFVTMVIAALIIDGLFSGLGLIPTGPRPSRGDIFGTIAVNYKLLLNLLGLVVFGALFWLTARRGTTDPVCGMKVDRAKAVRKDFAGETFYFCGKGCAAKFDARHAGAAGPPPPPAPPLPSPTRADATRDGPRQRRAASRGRLQHGDADDDPGRQPRFTRGTARRLDRRRDRAGFAHGQVIPQRLPDHDCDECRWHFSGDVPARPRP